MLNKSLFLDLMRNVEYSTKAYTLSLCSNDGTRCQDLVDCYFGEPVFLDFDATTRRQPPDLG